MPLIEKVDVLPARKKQKATIYDEVINSVEKSGKGIYKVNISDRKTVTVYAMLSKRLKNRSDMKLYVRGETIYIEKL
ncbi:MAG: hypothetical protein ACPLKS_07475 [Caldisericum exile]|uniref:hypothetical protein n=1 Tax=Caldisericum exile TaxID=693075 RepID=UPI003C78CB6D